MNKKQRALIGIALLLLFTGIAIVPSAASSDRELYAFDQNPAGRDEGNEWLTIYNPLNESVDIGNWTLENADGERETIPEGYPLSRCLLCLLSLQSMVRQRRRSDSPKRCKKGRSR